MLQSVCQRCGGPLLARYRTGDPRLPGLEDILGRPPGQFRFQEMLPHRSPPLTLGEGGTPMWKATAIRGSPWIKDEAQNPTGSFKARGMAVALPRNLELGAGRFCLPSNGNAGGAAAAYGALYDVRIEVAVPASTPRALIEESRELGATVTIVEGTIADAAARQREELSDRGWFSLATLHEPYRVEGKKMMGYEIFWDLGHLPDVVIFPTGGGTGLVGMLKAFDEMEALGWIGSDRPRMVAAQVEGCSPIVAAFGSGADRAFPWAEAAETSAYGLRVPYTIGDQLMLTGLRRTGGIAISVNEHEMIDAARMMATRAGIWGSPEGGAGLAAHLRLLEAGWIAPDDEVVLFNTGSALKYLDGPTTQHRALTTPSEPEPGVPQPGVEPGVRQPGVEPGDPQPGVEPGVPQLISGTNPLIYDENLLVRTRRDEEDETAAARG